MPPPDGDWSLQAGRGTGTNLGRVLFDIRAPGSPIDLLSPSERAIEYSRYVRLLALAGKKYFRKHLFDPLSSAGWKKTGPRPEQQLARLRTLVLDPAFNHTLAIHCKRLVGAALEEGLAPLGDAVLFFLDLINASPKVAIQKEAVELLTILEPALTDFRKLQDDRSQVMFTDALNHLKTDDFRDAFAPVELGTLGKGQALDQKIRMLSQQILTAGRKDDIPRCAKLLSRYIIDFSDSDEYKEAEINKIRSALQQKEPQFERVLKDMMALEVYYLISRGIMQGDVKAAIRGIRKYAHIFEGNADTRFFYEIDRLERVLYALISQKDLWQELKRTET